MKKILFILFVGNMSTHCLIKKFAFIYYLESKKADCKKLDKKLKKFILLYILWYLSFALPKIKKNFLTIYVVTFFQNDINYIENLIKL